MTSTDPSAVSSFRSARASLADLVRQCPSLGDDPLLWGPLLAGTLLLHVVSVLLQGLVWMLIAWYSCQLIGETSPPALTHAMFFAAIAPGLLAWIAWSTGDAGVLWQAQIGARAPSEREQRRFEDALAVLRGEEPLLRAPARWCVLDSAEVRAACAGEMLMLTTAALKSEWLAAVVAHELAHLNTRDSRLIAMLSTIAGPLRTRWADAEPRGLAAQVARPVSWVLTGELALRIASPAWGSYFRSREYDADRHAAQLGQAQALTELLEHVAEHGDAHELDPLLNGSTHPPVEHRIQELQRFQRGRGEAPLLAATA